MRLARVGRTAHGWHGVLAGAAALAVIGAVAPAAAVAASATPTPVKVAAGPFRITKLKPAHITVHANGTYKNLKIYWAGQATFPITVYSVPKPGCTHGGVTCYSNSHVFQTGNHVLTWANFAGCSNELISGPGGPAVSRPSVRWTGHWGIHLQDAAKKKTKAVTFTLTCLF
jgi:hypothetical protein